MTLNTRMEFPRLYLYLAPIMTTATRSALRRMDMYQRRGQLSSSDAAHLFMGIIRSAIETQQTQSQRVHLGLHTLLKVVDVTTEDIGKAIRGSRAIPPQMIGYVQEYVKSLDQPRPAPIRNPRLQEYYQTIEQDLEKRRVKRVAEELEKRRAKRIAEQKKMELAARQRIAAQKTRLKMRG